MIKNTHGIEGDDILFHLGLLGYDVGTLTDKYFFFPLNDHYNTHTSRWIEEATLLAKSKEVVVFYDLVNTGDYDHIKFCQFVSEFNHPTKVYLTVNQSPNLKLANVKIIPWDFMWNRTRAYYTESIPETLHLHHYAMNQYHLPKLDFTRTRNKTFLSLTGRDYGYRTPLYEMVKEYNGYVSNRSKNIYLEQEHVLGAFSPVPNEFYLDSYFSVYVESNCLQTDLIHITEKTFDPLLKGHIILPFSNPGTITRLQDMGFRFPEFIDYSYDSIQNPDARFSALIDQFKHLIMQNLPKLYTDNADIFIHNQNCIKTIPYDTRILDVFNV